MGGDRERERELSKVQPKHAKIRKKTKCEGAIHA
jgi:hypothetical protein